MTDNNKALTTFFDWILHTVDPRFYFQFRLIPMKVVFKYAAILIFLATSVVSMSVAFQVYRQVGDMVPIYREHFPPMEISGGKLLVSGETPIVYSGKETQVIVDPSGNTTRQDSLFPRGVVFEEERVVFFYNSYKPIEMPYARYAVEDFTIDADMLLMYRPSMAVITFFLWEFLFLLSWLVSKAMYVVVASLFVGMVSEMHRVILARNHRLIIATSAVMPIVILEMVETLLHSSDLMSLLFRTEFTGFFIFNLCVFAILIMFGTRAYIAPFINQQSEE